MLMARAQQTCLMPSQLPIIINTFTGMLVYLRSQRTQD